MLPRAASRLIPSSTCRRGHRTLGNDKKSSDVVRLPGLTLPHANGGITFGGVLAPNTLAPARSRPRCSASFRFRLRVITEMVPRIARSSPHTRWSPKLNRTVVFFRLLVVVSAPRFTQRPRYEWPTNPCVSLVAVTQDDRVAQLTSYLAVIADRRSATRSPRICESRRQRQPNEMREWGDGRALSDHIGPPLRRVRPAAYLGALFYKDSSAADHRRVCQLGRFNAFARLGMSSAAVPRGCR